MPWFTWSSRPTFFININQKCQQAGAICSCSNDGYFVGIALGIIGFVIRIAGGIGMGMRPQKDEYT